MQFGAKVRAEQGKSKLALPFEELVLSSPFFRGKDRPLLYPLLSDCGLRVEQLEILINKPSESSIYLK